MGTDRLLLPTVTAKPLPRADAGARMARVLAILRLAKTGQRLEDTDEGTVMVGMMAVFAEWERRCPGPGCLSIPSDRPLCHFCSRTIVLAKAA